MVVENMANPQEKQGYLGNLEGKGRVELTDLLLRQERLLSNQKFIQRLPDKGEKILKLVDRINKILTSQGDVDNTAELLEKLQLNADRSRLTRTAPATAQSDDDEDDRAETEVLSMMVNKTTEGKMITDERVQVSTVDAMITDERVQVSTVDATKPVNTYQKIIRKESSPADVKMSKFKLNSSLRIREMEKLPEKMRGPQVAKSMMDQDLPNMEQCERDVVVLEPSESINSQNEDTRDIRVPAHTAVSDSQSKTPPSLPHRHVYDEALQIDTENMRHVGGAKMLSLQESFLLQQRHHNYIQEMQVKQAAEKLAGRMGGADAVKFYDPEGFSDTRYRENQAIDSDTDEGDEAELDYPD